MCYACPSTVFTTMDALLLELFKSTFGTRSPNTMDKIPRARHQHGQYARCLWRHASIYFRCSFCAVTPSVVARDYGTRVRDKCTGHRCLTCCQVFQLLYHGASVLQGSSVGIPALGTREKVSWMGPRAASCLLPGFALASKRALGGYVQTSSAALDALKPCL